MQCFCKRERKNGHSMFEKYEQTDSRFQPYEGKLCYNFFSDIYISKVIGQSISIFVVLYNIVLKYTIVYLVLFIGEETSSQ